MTVFFTSDTHFGHAKIIETCDRPFACVPEMDEAIAARWNERIGPSDTVYHLGDFCFRAEKSAREYLDRLNGRIHLIIGNHDAEALRESERFASVQPMLEVRIGRQDIVLCHYPMREWHRSWRGSWHLFGHVHGRLNHLPHGYSLDVGVDSHDFTPWAVEELALVMQGRDNPFEDGKRLKPVSRTP